MKNLLTILTLLCAFVINAQDKPTQTIRGIIVDQQTESPLIGATIVVLESDPFIGASTDLDGKFRLENVPAGRQTLSVSYLGYEPRIMPNMLVTSGKEMVLTIALQESFQSLNEIVIESEATRGENINQMATVSARTFSVEETKRYAGAIDDPARMASSYAGVGAVDGNNDLVIRGNSPRGMLWRMEGIEIPNPNHFSSQGASGGPISMLSTNMMANSEFFTGAFPAEYGNATSGIFDINLRKGNNEKREYSLGIGILGTDLAVEGPFSKNYDGSYLINYRYSTLSMFSLIGLDIVGDVVPKFQDLSFNFYLPAGKAGNFSLFGVLGNGVATEEWEYDSKKYDDIYTANMGVTGLKHTYLIGSKTLIKTTVAAMGVQRMYDAEVADSNGNFLYVEDNSTMEDIAMRANTTISHKFNGRHALRTGLTFNQLGYDFFEEYYDDELQKQIRTQDDEGEATRLESFAQWQFRATEDLTINAGLHQTYFNLNKQNVIEPRAGARYALGKSKWLNAGFGIHSSTHDLSVYSADVTRKDGTTHQANKDLGMTRAMHYVLGYEQMINKNLRVKAEVYYQNLFDVPIVDSSNSAASAINSYDGFANAPLKNKGTGYNYGAELTIEKYFTNNWFMMVTSSLYQSKYVAGDGKERNTLWNANYVNNFQGGKEFKLKKPGRVLSVSSKLVWAGGQRFTPVLLDESREAGYSIRDDSKIFDEKMRDYFRLDAQLTYRIDRPKTTHSFKIDIQNATNRENYFSQFYNPETENLDQSTLLGILPVLSYKVQF
jgi:hypothetical protein